MLSIAVCDDEILECCQIAGKIEKIAEEMKIHCILYQYYSGKELLQAKEAFDIVFLDIIMDDLNGMKTAKLLRRRKSAVILVFITSSREYVFDAYDVEAFQYLMKPVEDHKLKNVLKRAVQKMEDHPQDYIVVSQNRLKKKLRLEDIYYFEILGRVIYAHEKGETFAFYERIGTLENRLQGKDFFRCHKSYLINLKHVDSYNRQEIVLDNGEKIVMAKRRYEEFCREILAFMRKNGGIV